jgi:hypothetical protein
MSGIGSPQTVKGARGGEPAETPDIRSGATFPGPHVCAMGANADGDEAQTPRKIGDCCVHNVLYRLGWVLGKNIKNSKDFLVLPNKIVAPPLSLLHVRQNVQNTQPP